MEPNDPSLDEGLADLGNQINCVNEGTAARNLNRNNHYEKITHSCFISYNTHPVL